jgi:hypothetical protein
MTYDNSNIVSNNNINDDDVDDNESMTYDKQFSIVEDDTDTRDAPLLLLLRRMNRFFRQIQLGRRNRFDDPLAVGRAEQLHEGAHGAAALRLARQVGLRTRDRRVRRRARLLGPMLWSLLSSIFTHPIFLRKKLRFYKNMD